MMLDFACAIVLGVFGLIGFLKGLLSQVISIVAIIAGVCSAVFLSEPATQLIMQWLGGRTRESSVDPGLVKLGAFVVLLFVVYIVTASLLEAVKKKLIHTFSLQLSDRLMGLLAGLVKGAGLLLLVVIIADGARGFVGRVMSPQGSERYQTALDQSDVFSVSRYALGLSRDNSPAVSNIIRRIEMWLPEPAAQKRP